MNQRDKNVQPQVLAIVKSFFQINNTQSLFMEIIVNGESRQMAEQATIADLIAELQLVGRRLAVEVNLEIAPRSTHAEHKFQTGDKVEIVHAIGGG